MQINLEHAMFLKDDTGFALWNCKVSKLTMNHEEYKPWLTFLVV